MQHFNLEIKARTQIQDQQESLLLAAGAVFHGEDQQTDTYFQVPSGRLKLRQGPIENSLIFYERPESDGPRRSDVYLAQLSPENEITSVLSEALGVVVQVKKRRKIYFIASTKFHLDKIEGLGTFIEIEVISQPGDSPEDAKALCEHYMKYLHISSEDLCTGSYADMLLNKH
jgi:adenylate cyclase, class 2